MQAQIQSQSQVPPSFGRRQAVVSIAALYVAIHVAWFAGPWIAPDHDFPFFTQILTGTTLAVGLIAITGLWQGYRWGWWALLVINIIQVFLTVPEVFTLPGILRVISILALVALAAILVLMFRPNVRAARS